jgi:aryl-alcohol dehydrogenase-like predicted oxidoreductase
LTTEPLPAQRAGTFDLGGDLRIGRLGYGTMQLPGPGVWGPPRDHDEAIRVLRRAVELGVNFIDTADSYGPHVAEELIAEALHPYPADLVIATKAGLTRFGPVTRSGPSQWPPVGRPEYLRQEAEMSLRRMKLERIDLFQLHRIDPKVPFEDQIGELKRLQDEGKIRHIGLSGVSVGQLTDAREIVTVVSVQNQFNLADRSAEPVLDYCAGQGIAFIPYRPLTTGSLAGPDGPLAELVTRHDASAAQLALAWLLRRSPVTLPIPGTSSVAHLEDNIRGASVALTDDEVAQLTAAVPS